ncbi:ABC transporter substrate-binding protein [Streptomyces fildesensis]|uniref:ABC transporter substrate-binding protein n=1 Tax=Streptomyces fildesensis TaxID=375757 RepID=A0ABW8C8I8_9ACTN
MRPPSWSRLRPLAVPLLVAVVLPLAAACGGASSAAETSGSGKVTLRIGDQGQSVATTLKAAGQLKNLPYKVEFNQFDSGPLVNQALQAGAIDFGTMGDTPALFAQASGIAVKVIAASTSDGPGYTLVARPGSGIRTAADLKGRKVAYSRNTANQGFLLRVLKKEGLKQQDITPVDVPLQNVGNVLESGTVDAAPVTEETRVKYLADHPDAVQIVNARAFPSIYSYRLASDKALADPDKRAALQDFTHRLVLANTWIRTHPDEWVQAYYVGVRKQTRTVGKQVWQGSGSTSYVPVDATVRAAQQAQSDLFEENGQLPKHVDISPQFDLDLLRNFNSQLTKG